MSSCTHLPLVTIMELSFESQRIQFIVLRKHVTIETKHRHVTFHLAPQNTRVFKEVLVALEPLEV